MSQLNLMPPLLTLLGEMNLEISYLLIQISSLILIRLLEKHKLLSCHQAFFHKYSYVLFEGDSKRVIEDLQNINVSLPWFLVSYLPDFKVALSSLFCRDFSFVSMDVNFFSHRLARQAAFYSQDGSISIFFSSSLGFFPPGN